jgi:hypothetical protein
MVDVPSHPFDQMWGNSPGFRTFMLRMGVATTLCKDSEGKHFLETVRDCTIITQLELRTLR